MNASNEKQKPSPESLRWAETLIGGSKVQIRPLLPEDAEAERKFIEDLSPQSRRFRFMGQVVHPSAALIAQLTQVDFRHDIALAATVPGFGGERLVGVGRYCAESDQARCEVAVTVAEDWRERGLGTVLMRHLIEVARQRGIRVMYSIDGAENLVMAALAQDLGFVRQLDRDDASQCIHTLNLVAS